MVKILSFCALHVDQNNVLPSALFSLLVSNHPVLYTYGALFIIYSFNLYSNCIKALKWFSYEPPPQFFL